jgi:hypothetical protein
MPWCPSCGNEYRDGFKKCSDCGTDLVDKLADEQLMVDDMPQDADHEEFLISVGDKFEADIIEAKLQSYNIPVLRKYKEAGGYTDIYMGMSITGIELYVPSKLLDDAKEIVKTEQVNLAAEENEMAENVAADNYGRLKRAGAWLALLIFGSGIIFVLISIIKALF